MNLDELNKAAVEDYKARVAKFQEEMRSARERNMIDAAAVIQVGENGVFPAIKYIDTKDYGEGKPPVGNAE